MLAILRELVTVRYSTLRTADEFTQRFSCLARNKFKSTAATAYGFGYNQKGHGIHIKKSD